MTTIYSLLKQEAEAYPLAFMRMMQPGGRYDSKTECYYAATPQGGEGTACVTSLKPGKKQFHGRSAVSPGRGWRNAVGIAMAAFETDNPYKAVTLALERLSLPSWNLNKQDVPDHPKILSIAAYKCKCRSVWCQKCYGTMYYPKIVEQLKKFNHKHTVMATCTFDPGKCLTNGDSKEKKRQNSLSVFN